jgi:hypothetical protein
VSAATGWHPIHDPLHGPEIKQSGFSRGYTVADSAGHHWSAKFPPEASTEVVASRLHWGIGYHQPPVYLLTDWTADKATSPNPQLPARFRESKPDLHGLNAKGTWSYYRNPFVGTPQLQGLLVLQAMLGNSDLKDDNNVTYALSEAFEGARTWYVARDLGHTFGRTAAVDAPRGDIQVFRRDALHHRRRQRRNRSTGADDTTRSFTMSSHRTSAGSAPGFPH